MKNLITYELFESNLSEASPLRKEHPEAAPGKVKPTGIITGATTLKKLTEKSKLDFGKWTGATVSSLIDREPQYLRWVYFNSSNIDFFEDVLTAIGIPTDIRIKKPGKDPELGKKLDQEINKVFGFKKGASYDFENALNHAKMNQVATAMKREKKPNPDNDQRTYLKFGHLEGGAHTRQDTQRPVQ